MPMYVVEYTLTPESPFPGFGGYPGKNGKLLGITDTFRQDFNIVTSSSGYDYEKDIFPLFLAYSMRVSKDIEWNQNTGEVILRNQHLPFRKQVKLFELKNYVKRLLDETDEVVNKLLRMREEGFSNEEIDEERNRYSEVLNRRRMIRQKYKALKENILNATSVEQLNVNFEEEFTFGEQ